VLLPRGVSTDSSTLKVAVDHREVIVTQGVSERAVFVPLADVASDGGQEHVLEVWYALEGGRPPRGWISLEPATVDAADLSERCYWQLILPKDELLLWGDRDMAAENMVAWWSFGWRRQPMLEQGDLEQWIGASRQEPMPAATNRYLFTTFGTSHRLKIFTASRSLILLAASGIALSVGLLLLYFPTLRHPALLLAIGGVTLSCGFIYPQLAVIFAQAACLGVVLIVVARLLRMLLWRGAGRSTVHGRTQFSDSNIVEVRTPRADGSSGVTTAPAPVVNHLPAAESKS
jgi:hypothetical protein